MITISKSLHWCILGIQNGSIGYVLIISILTRSCFGSILAAGIFGPTSPSESSSMILWAAWQMLMDLTLGFSPDSPSLVDIKATSALSGSAIHLDGLRTWWDWQIPVTFLVGRRVKNSSTERADNEGPSEDKEDNWEVDMLDAGVWLVGVMGVLSSGSLNHNIFEGLLRELSVLSVHWLLMLDILHGIVSFSNSLHIYTWH